MEFKSTNIKYIPIDRLKHHPDNPRKDLGDLSELSESIAACLRCNGRWRKHWLSQLVRRSH